jgi:uncharacterized repeat protein (TIGR01451 family)
LERDWLNAEIPGIVDGNGIMDTLHPEIASVDSAVFIVPSSAALADLVGVQYLSTLESLSLGSDAVVLDPNASLSVTIEALPGSLKKLTIDMVSYGAISLDLPALPEEMEKIDINLLYSVNRIHIAAMPVDLLALTLSHVDSLSWEGSAQTDYLNLYGNIVEEPTDLSVPSLVVVESTQVNDMWVTRLDLSDITTQRLRFSNCLVDGELLWPQVEMIEIDFTELRSELAPFPEGLESLSCFGAIMACLPYLPTSMIQLIEVMIPIPCLPNWPDGMLYSPLFEDPENPTTPETANYCSVLNSNCPGAYPALAGDVRMDLNNNGTVDADEPMVPSSTVTIAPGGQSIGCAPDGSWQIGVPPGEHTITTASAYPYAVSVNPASHSGSVPAMGDVDLNNDFAVAVLSDIQDLRVHVYADPARPGFDNQVHLHCENYGTTPVDAELNLVFDADQTWLSSSVAPANTSSNTATWSFPAMPIGAVHHIVVDLTTAATVALGTDITHTLTADPTSTDETPLDNVFIFNDSVVGSYDPNDKLLSPAVLTPDEVALGETPIEYTIRFQNTGTYLAERVVILDTLSEDLQWESMRFIASSHDQHWYIVDGVLHVVYNEIMLPDSNTNEAASHGFFKFSMLPKTDLVNGSNIENIAHIVFDFNAPIITPPAVFTVDIGAGVVAVDADGTMRVTPNPANDRIRVGIGTVDPLPYRIMNALGQPVMSGLLGVDGWLDIEALPKGAYVLEVRTPMARSSLRWIKQ